MYLSALEEPRTWKTEVYWIYGASGSGKSRLIYELAQSDAYWKDDTKWWDGYDKHHTVVWDDFRGHCCHLTYLLKILDRYPLRVEQKGGYRQFLAKENIHKQHSTARKNISNDGRTNTAAIAPPLSVRTHR